MCLNAEIRFFSALLTIWSVTYEFFPVFLVNIPIGSYFYHENHMVQGEMLHFPLECRLGIPTYWNIL